MSGRYRCDLCSFSSGDEAYARAHAAKPHRPCPECGRPFAGLAAHVRRAHASPERKAEIARAISDGIRRSSERWGDAYVVVPVRDEARP